MSNGKPQSASNAKVDIEYPSLLVVTKLLRPLAQGDKRIHEIEGKLAVVGGDAVLLSGCFALAVAVMETALLDSRLYHLSTSYEAYQFDKAEITKAELFASPLTLDIYRRRVREKVRSEAYKSFRSQLVQYTSALEIGTPPLDDKLLDAVIEVKETRNLLLHNDLIVNEQYLEKAGPAKRSSNIGARLAVNGSYAVQSIANCLRLLQELQARASAKHAGYTKVAALRRVWSYLFDSPVMKFEDYWAVDEAQDKVLAMKRSKYEPGLANSERMLLSTWRYHFNGFSGDVVNISMRSLDRAHRRKLFFFLSVIGELALE